MRSKKRATIPYSRNTNTNSYSNRSSEDLLIKKRRKRYKHKKKFHLGNLFLSVVTPLVLIFAITKMIAPPSSNDVITVSEIPEPKDIPINISVVGDIMCHSSNYQDAYIADQDTYDFSPVFTDIKEYLQNADLTIGNVETTFSGKNIGYSGYPTFNTPEQLANNLVDLGVDVVSTANNHSLDKNYTGIEGTINTLDAVGIAHTGTYKSVEDQNTIITKEINGVKFAFLSFTYGTNGIPVPAGREYCINLIDKNLILDQISKAKELQPDFICASMHWGEEYKVVPNNTQKELADFLFENDVDIIFGSHPHVLQPMEQRTITKEDGTTKNVFVIYSLGNFMSGQQIENTRNSIILNLHITKHIDGTITFDSYDYIPTYMLDRGQGANQRFQILDVNKTIENYEAGNSDVSEKLYNTLKKVKDTIDNQLIMK